MADFRFDIQSVATQLQGVEAATSRQETQIQQVSDSHSFQLREMHRHLEELNNRGRKHNIRLRGLSKSIEPGNLHQCVQSIFNTLLDRPHDSPIEMEHMHRALRPKGRDSDPPHNVICCLVSFPQKEDILKRVRERR